MQHKKKKTKKKIKQSDMHQTRCSICVRLNENHSVRRGKYDSCAQCHQLICAHHFTKHQVLCQQTVYSRTTIRGSRCSRSQIVILCDNCDAEAPPFKSAGRRSTNMIARWINQASGPLKACCVCHTTYCRAHLVGCCACVLYWCRRHTRSSESISFCTQCFVTALSIVGAYLCSDLVLVVSRYVQRE